MGGVWSPDCFRQPRRDSAHFPPGRALLASVQNFQLVPAAADPSLGQKKSSGSVVLVHGLMNEAEDGVDTYSLDFAHPLSPIVAFGAVLAAQAWQ